MAQNCAKPPEPLLLEDRLHRGQNWKKFRRDWEIYEVAAKIYKEAGVVRVAAFKNVIGDEALDMFETLTGTMK